MKKQIISLNITNFKRNVSLNEAVNMIYKNAYDEHIRSNTEVPTYTLTDDKTLIIKDGGKGIEANAFVITGRTGNSDKQKANAEGLNLKIAVSRFMDLKKEVKFITKNATFTPFSKYDEITGTTLTFVEITDGDSSMERGTRVEITNMDPSVLKNLDERIVILDEKVKENFKKVHESDRLDIFEALTEVKETDDESRKNFLAIDGIIISRGSKTQNLRYSYNLKGDQVGQRLLGKGSHNPLSKAMGLLFKRINGRIDEKILLGLIKGFSTETEYASMLKHIVSRLNGFKNQINGHHKYLFLTKTQKSKDLTETHLNIITMKGYEIIEVKDDKKAILTSVNNFESLVKAENQDLDNLGESLETRKIADEDLTESSIEVLEGAKKLLIEAGLVDETLKTVIIERDPKNKKEERVRAFVIPAVSRDIFIMEDQLNDKYELALLIIHELSHFGRGNHGTSEKHIDFYNSTESKALQLIKSLI